MNAGATADRVYDALKRRLLSGVVIPGERLEPGLLAEDLSSSVTPVRDALHRLVGERLVATGSGTGFHLAVLHEPDLRDLYSWNVLLLLDAMRLWEVAAVPVTAITAGDRIDATRALFRLIGARTGNAEVLATIEAASDRLNAAREAEEFALGPLAHETAALIAVVMAADRTAILRELRHYHRRRLTSVPAIVRAMYRPR